MRVLTEDISRVRNDLKKLRNEIKGVESTDKKRYNYITDTHVADTSIHYPQSAILANKLEEDIFPVRMSVIRNQEMNNLLSTSSGTEIVVSAIDTAANTITLSWVPYIDSLFSPTLGKEWALLNLENTDGGADPSRSGDYTEALRLDSGTYSTRVFNYNAVMIHGSETNWSVGDKVMLYNPFESGWEWSASNPLIAASGTGWRQTYVNPGGLFKKTDGTWILLVNGINGAGDHSIGAFSSTDLVAWSVLNSDNAVFVPSGVNDWRRDNLFCSSSVLKLKTEDRYILYVAGYNNLDAKWRIGWVKFDEDLTAGSREYASSEIIDSSASSYGLYASSVIRYGSQYRMIYTDRWDNDNPDLATGGWRCREAFSDIPEGLFVYSHEVFAGLSTNDGIYYSNHTDAYSYFIYKNRLYCIVGGTSRYLASGNRGNRVYGLMYWDERKATPAWTHDPRSPIFINTLFGDELWGSSYGWARDHVGGYPVEGYNDADGKLYMYWSSNTGLNTYKVGLITLDIQTL